MSDIVIHDKKVYLSGQVDETGAKDIAGQTRGTLAEIDRLLALAGTNKSKLIRATIWLKDIEKDFGGMNAVWTEWVDPENKPVRATTEAKLASGEYLVEIQVEAALD
jgi:enamine deaminase RidA (YjgF/YER057c/UK114 family)